MTDPVQPAPPPVASTPVQQQPAAATPRTVIDAPVTQAPPQLQAPQQPVTVDGKVISSDPSAQLIRIQTAQGEIDVQSGQRLAPGTDVTVSLSMQRNTEVATITVLRRQLAVSEDLAQTIDTVQQQATVSLKAGDTVTALRLPPDNPLDQAVLNLSQMPPEQLAKLDLPPALLKMITDNPQALRQMPPDQQQQVLTALAAPLPVGPEDTIDNNLVQILRAQIGMKLMTQQMNQSPSAAPIPLSRSLGALLPLIEQLVPQAPNPASFAQAAPLPQNVFELKIVQVLPPNAPPAPGQAEVESLTPGGFPVIRTADGEHYVLQIPANLPVGTKLVIDAKPLTSQQVLQQITAGMTSSFEPLTAKTWLALEEALQAAPAEVGAAIRNTLPALSNTTAQRLPPAVLLFLATVRLGDVNNWLGEPALNALRATGRRDIADRLTGDFGKISEQAKETLPGGWKMISMPLLQEDHLSQMQFYVRRQFDESKKETPDGVRPVTRFLLNLSLSRLGDMQLDGFIQKKQFDLILRTDAPLSPGMRQEIMKRFAIGLDQVGMDGGMRFQAKRQSWVTVERPAQTGTVA